MIGPDEDGTAAIVEIVTRLAPPLVLFVDTSMLDESPAVKFHLAWSGAWISIECMLGVWGGDASAPDEAHDKPSEERRQELDRLMTDAAGHLAARNEPKVHDTLEPVRDAIIEHVALAGELSGDDREYMRFAAYDPAGDLFDKLMDAHRERFFTEASAFAAAIFAETEIPSDAKIAVIRSVAYRHMKRIDPKCVIKTELGSIEAALEKLVRAQ